MGVVPRLREGTRLLLPQSVHRSGVRQQSASREAPAFFALETATYDTMTASWVECEARGFSSTMTSAVSGSACR